MKQNQSLFFCLAPRRKDLISLLRQGKAKIADLAAFLYSLLVFTNHHHLYLQSQGICNIFVRTRHSGLILHLHRVWKSFKKSHFMLEVLCRNACNLNKIFQGFFLLVLGGLLATLPWPWYGCLVYSQIPLLLLYSQRGDQSLLLWLHESNVTSPL